MAALPERRSNTMAAYGWEKSGLARYVGMTVELQENLTMYKENDPSFTVAGTAAEIGEMAVESAMDSYRDAVTDEDVENALGLFFGGERWQNFGDRG